MISLLPYSILLYELRIIISESGDIEINFLFIILSKLGQVLLRMQILRQFPKFIYPFI
jgi:hypothetical protein